MRRIAVEEAFRLPEVSYANNAERIFGVSPAPTTSGVLS